MVTPTSPEVKAAQTLYRSIFVEHRVYALVAPKTGIVERCDSQLLRNDALAAEAARLQILIDKAANRQLDATLAQQRTVNAQLDAVRAALRHDVKIDNAQDRINAKLAADAKRTAAAAERAAKKAAAAAARAARRVGVVPVAA